MGHLLELGERSALHLAVEALGLRAGQAVLEDVKLLEALEITDRGRDRSGDSIALKV